MKIEIFNSQFILQVIDYHFKFLLIKIIIILFLSLIIEFLIFCSEPNYQIQ